MFIKCQEYYMVGSGLLESREVIINSDEISSVHDCGFESRPYSGLQRVMMQNGNKIYASFDKSVLTKNEE